MILGSRNVLDLYAKTTGSAHQVSDAFIVAYTLGTPNIFLQFSAIVMSVEMGLLMKSCLEKPLFNSQTAMVSFNVLILHYGVAANCVALKTLT